MPIDDRPSAAAPRTAMAPPWRPAMIGAAVAAAVTLLAFFALPLISFGPFRLTAAEIAGAPDTFGGTVPALGLLWAIPLAAAGALVAAVLSLTSTGGRGTLVALLGGVAVAVYVLALVVVLGEAGDAGAAGQVFSVIGAGFWVGVLGAVGAVVGGMVAARTAAAGEASAPAIARGLLLALVVVVVATVAVWFVAVLVFGIGL